MAESERCLQYLKKIHDQIGEKVHDSPYEGHRRLLTSYTYIVVQACAQENHRHLPSNVSRESVAAQTEGILTVTREAGAQAGGSSGAPLRLPPTALDQGVQTDETIVVSSEAETQAGGSSDALLRLPLTHQAVQTDETLVVSSEDRVQAGGEGIQAEVPQSEPETYGDQSGASSIQLLPSVDASNDEGAPTQEIHVVSGEQEGRSDDEAPQLPSTSSEVRVHVRQSLMMLLLLYHLATHCSGSWACSCL